MSEYTTGDFLPVPTDREIERFGIFTSSKAFEIKPEDGEVIGVSYGPDGIWLVCIARGYVETSRYNTSFVAYIIWKKPTPPEPAGMV